ncbi:ATP-dependent zinc metalloprotease FTSH 7 [Carex littledalei]|uniref:ATP-dependent zinc metalloprotease FTSH 7 n=1 Tax=Carex littledalei TaxID=544730 RepID=A0A833VEB2_9POAL|nr:ATP-dependent zinc metalloprotease FTSH 7 [Carex littledalei]
MHSTMDSLQFNPRPVPSNQLSKPRSFRFPSCSRDRSINPVLLCCKSKLFNSVPVHHTRFDPLHLIITSPNNKSTKLYANSSRKQDSESSSSDITTETTSNNSEGIQKPGKSSNSASASNSPSSNPPKKEKKWKNWWWRENRSRWDWKPIGENQDVGFLLLQLAVSFLAFRMLRLGNSFPTVEPVTTISVPYSEFLSKINNNQVQKVEVDGVHIMFKLKSDQSGFGSQSTSESTRPSQEMEEAIRTVAPTKRILYTTTRPVDIKTPYEKMLDNRVEFGSPDKRSGGFWNSVLVGLFYVVLIAGFLQRFPISFSTHTTGQLRKGKNSGSGGSKVSEQSDLITFADVAGVDEAKEELEEIVEFLRNPEKYVRLGARPPRGVLLVGMPGTGKTLLAKAVAGEADVPFISCSASEFVELYVGMGASRVRDLFSRAKREAPSIIFIDEIDAVAKSRDGKFRIVSNDEREQTLNQLLTEMDGFDSNSAVIVLAATNRADVLDPALRRPGRFDRVVMVEAPEKYGRESILKVHVNRKELPLAEDVDLSEIASMTTGFTGADLANLVNEAALLAGRYSKEVVEKIDFINAVERSIAGIEKKHAKLKGSEKAVVARHEAGHAVVGTAIANLLPGQPRVEKLSILPRSGGALGFTYTPPTTEDRYLLFIDELRGRLVTLLGGRAAEEVSYSGRVSTGALDDIRKATDMAYKAVAEYGLSENIGPLSLATLSNGGLDDSGGAGWGRDQGHLVDMVQREVKGLLQSALEVALSVIKANPTVLEGLGAYLEDKEKVEGEELQEWLKLVVAPSELAFFLRGKHENFLQLEMETSS